MNANTTMGKDKTDISTLLGTLLLASVTFGSVYWIVTFAHAQDAAYGRAISAIDMLMERAYGAALSDSQ